MANAETTIYGIVERWLYERWTSSRIGRIAAALSVLRAPPRRRRRGKRTRRMRTEVDPLDHSLATSRDAPRRALCRPVDVSERRREWPSFGSICQVPITFLLARCGIAARRAVGEARSRRWALSLSGRARVRFLGWRLRRYALERIRRHPVRGHLHNTREYEGCVIVERWDGASAISGHEHVVLRCQPPRLADGVERRRQQVERLRGRLPDGAMRFEGWILDADGKRLLSPKDVLENVSSDTMRPHLLDLRRRRKELGRVESDGRFARPERPGEVIESGMTLPEASDAGCRIVPSRSAIGRSARMRSENRPSAGIDRVN